MRAGDINRNGGRGRENEVPCSFVALRVSSEETWSLWCAFPACVCLSQTDGPLLSAVYASESVRVCLFVFPVRKCPGHKNSFFCVFFFFRGSGSPSISTDSIIQWVLADCCCSEDALFLAFWKDLSANTGFLGGDQPYRWWIKWKWETLSQGSGMYSFFFLPFPFIFHIYNSNGTKVTGLISHLPAPCRLLCKNTLILSVFIL